MMTGGRPRFRALGVLRIYATKRGIKTRPFPLSSVRRNVAPKTCSPKQMLRERVHPARRAEPPEICWRAGEVQDALRSAFATPRFLLGG